VIDLHSHILPGLDDGVRSLGEARELARNAAREGVTAIAATPHVRWDYPTTADQMEEGVAALRRDFDEQGIPVDVLPGAEIEAERVVGMSHAELVRLSLAGTGRYVLVEFPYRGWPVSLDASVQHVTASGLTPVLGHPERNPEVQDRPARLEELVAAGAVVQVTAGSVLDWFGPAAKRAAERLLALRLAHLLATDAHGPHIRQGGLRAAAEALDDPLLAAHLTVSVPAAIAAGQGIPPLPDVRP
jgi:protein-tyrosine phosphatase